MTRLPGEVEDDVLTANERFDAVPVADVGDVDADTVADVRDVVLASTVLRDQRVDEHDICPRVDERSSERRADEAEPTRDQHPATRVLCCEISRAHVSPLARQ